MRDEEAWRTYGDPQRIHEAALQDPFFSLGYHHDDEIALTLRVGDVRAIPEMMRAATALLDEARAEIGRLRELERQYRLELDKDRARRTELEEEIQRWRKDYNEGSEQCNQHVDRLRARLAKLEQGGLSGQVNQLRSLLDRTNDRIIELEEEIERLRNKLNTDSQNFEIECLRAEGENLRARITELGAREVTAEMVEATQHDPAAGGTWFRLISGTHAPDWPKGTKVVMRVLHSSPKEVDRG